MRQGITTRYIGPTNTKGPRIKALARVADGHGNPAMQKTIPLDYELSLEGRHLKAAQALATELGWAGLWAAGGLPTEDGYMFVNVGPHGAAFAEGLEGYDWFYVAEPTR